MPAVRPRRLSRPRRPSRRFWFRQSRMNKKTIRDVDVRGKRVFVRVDFNVPLDDGQITDDRRIREALPTIVELRRQGARVILASHLGRPDGKVMSGLRLDPVAVRLSELLGAPVRKLPDCVGPEVARAVAEMRDGDVVLLENLRDRKSTRLNSSHPSISYAVFCLKKKKQ